MATYSEREDVENVYGEENVRDWADINANGDPAQIAARITWARERAYTRINSRLRSTRYKVPFESPFPQDITECEADLAGFYLFQARRLDGDDQTVKNLSHMKKAAYETLDQITSGILTLDVDLQGHTNAPSVYSDE